MDLYESAFVVENRFLYKGLAEILLSKQAPVGRTDCTVTRLCAGHQGSRGSFPGKYNRVTSAPIVQTGDEAHPASYTMGALSSFCWGGGGGPPGEKGGRPPKIGGDRRGIRLASHLNLGPRVRMNGAIRPLPVWVQDVHRDDIPCGIL